MGLSEIEIAIRQLAEHQNDLARAINQMPHPEPPAEFAGGKWAILFRASLVVGAMLLPLLVSLNVWMISNLFAIRADVLSLQHDVESFRNAGPRYTARDARGDLLELEQRITQQIRNFENEFTRDFVRKDEI